jgi:hypothetical protein
MRVTSVVIFSLFLSACAGSPVHTSSMSPSELTSIDDYTLCKAATPRELYDPSINVVREVQRRNLNCRQIYTYTPTPMPVIVTPSQPQQGTHTYLINGKYVTCTTTGNVTNCF